MAGLDTNYYFDIIFYFAFDDRIFEDDAQRREPRA